MLTYQFYGLSRTLGSPIIFHVSAGCVAVGIPLTSSQAFAASTACCNVRPARRPVAICSQTLVACQRSTRPGRVARPFEFHTIVSASHSNTTPARPLRVKILILGCPVLDAFQGQGFCFDLSCLEEHTKSPALQYASRTGHPTSTTKPGPPAESSHMCPRKNYLVSILFWL